MWCVPPHEGPASMRYDPTSDKAGCFAIRIGALSALRVLCSRLNPGTQASGHRQPRLQCFSTSEGAAYKMAAVWQPDSLWTQQIGGCTGMLPGAPCHFVVESQALDDNPVSRWSSVTKPALPSECVAAAVQGFHSDGRRQEQELLWRNFFLNPAVWWDNRRRKKGFYSPDFRRKGSNEALWLNSILTPAWVDERLVAWDLQMGHGASPLKWSSVDKSDPARRAESKSGVVTPATVRTLCQQGKLDEAFAALQTLAERGDGGVSKSLLYTVLKLCAVKKNVAVGELVHNLCVKLGYEADTYLGNHILRMYACGGRLQEAMDVFTRVGKPDAFMWGSIISAHCKHGRPNEAVKLYHEMRSSGLRADAHVFVAALQACALAADLESGRDVHFDVLRSGIPPDLFVGNSLVDMYAKCGELEDARGVFDSLGTKDVVTWNALIAGYAQQGFAQDALLLYEKMVQEALVVADHVTFICLLKACANSGALQRGKELHSEIVERGLLKNSLVANCLVGMYAKCGQLRDARLVFDTLASKDVVTWNALMAGYAQQGLAQEALVLYGQMEQEGRIVADHVTFASLLKACANARCLQKGRQLHSQIVARGLVDNIVIGTCLVDMYAKCGELEAALRVFDCLATKNEVTWTALIAGYANCGNMEGARQVFDTLATRDVVTWNALIAGYVQQGLGQEALALYERMEQEGHNVANHVTFACLLKACASAGAVQKGKQLHSQIVERGLLDKKPVGTCLVDMYAKCGELKAARQVFDCLATKDVVSWNALISGCGVCDEGREALACFEEMLAAGIQPDVATFTCLLVACSHEGLVSEGRKHFNSMVEQHGMEPASEHYICMIDLLGRAGHLDEAENMLLSFDGQSNVVGLRSLLSACKKHGDVERATRCFESLVRLEPQHAAAYVLMANAFADAGRWTDVEKIERQRLAAGAKKKHAVAGIEVNMQVHTFLVGEYDNDISLKVDSLDESRRQEVGHLPHTKLVLKAVSEKEKEDLLCGHAEKLALAYGLLNTPSGTPLMVTKNLRMCSDCHSSTEIMSRIERRDIVVRDGYRVHRFASGLCSCKGRP